MLQSWVIEVPTFVPAVEGRAVGVVEGCAGAKTCHEVRIGKGVRTKSDRIRETRFNVEESRRQIGVAAVEEQHAGPVETDEFDEIGVPFCS